VINPVGAIVNGLELLDEGPDASTRDMAIDMIKKSAGMAAARLKFARIAFGAAGSAGSAIDTRDAQSVAVGFLNDDRTTVEWNIPAAYLPKNRVKLLLNLVLIGVGAIPRGGVVRVDPLGDGDTMGFLITVTGLNVRLPPHAADLVAGIPVNEQGSIDAHAVQPYYTGVLARAAGITVTMAHDGERFVLRAV
jgi:histidine phosphotransferase ChpT